MPILPLEPFLYPGELLSHPDAIRTEDARWWALYTKSRAEKTLARQLLAREVSFFLPLYKHEYRCSGRLVKGYLPLFGGYLFLHGDEDARIQALKTNLVLSTLFVEDQAQLETDLVQVYRLMDSGLTLAPEQHLQPGALVEIFDGPLAGIRGTLLGHGSRMRVFVNVEFLQSAVSVEVDSSLVRPAPV